MPKKLLIFGLGLIGGSILKSLQSSGSSIGLSFGLPYEVSVIDKDPETLNSALKAGLCNHAFDSIESYQASNQLADLAIACAPPSVNIVALPQLILCCKVLTDVSSVKSSIAQAVKLLPASDQARFILGHPIAGTEHSGFASSIAGLFDRAKVVMCPESFDDDNQKVQENALKVVVDFWQSLGCQAKFMDSATHDKLFAAVSHLPHALSWLTLHAIREHASAPEISDYTEGGGLKSLTRLSASDPSLWSEVFVANKQNLLDDLANYEKKISGLKNLIQKGDKDALKVWLQEGREQRIKLWPKEQLHD